jgi:uncharacterized protein (TIGR02594 family)
MAAAWAELGAREVPGPAANARIAAFYREVGHPRITGDETPWCAAFLGACLERAGIASTRSLLARSYLRWGSGIATPRLGAIAVFTRGEDPGAGHVGFWLGEGGEEIMLLGGNQADMVSVAPIARARLLGYRWFEAADAGGGRDAAPAARDAFEACLAHVLAMEGGWSDDPYDPGGPTMQGITLATYARHRGIRVGAENFALLKEELRAIPPALVREMYLERYWQPSGAGGMAPAVALMHFDAAVNHGVLAAIRMLQEALGVEADGEIGPVTQGALRTADQAGLIAAYADLRRARYRSLPHFWRFGRGWLNRVTATLAAARRALGAGPTPRTPTAKGDPTMTPQSTRPAAAEPHPAGTPKWWGQSLTVWGALITALSTVLPALGPLIGLDITAEMVRQLGQQAVAVVQAVGGLVGTLMTLYGRARASAPLERREVRVSL